MRKNRPKVLEVSAYMLPPPTVLYVTEAPLIGESSIGALLEKMFAMSKSWMDVSKYSSSVVADQQRREELAKTISEAAEKVLKMRDEAQVSFMLYSKFVPVNVIEAGRLFRAFLGTVASLGVLKSLHKEKEARTLLELALWELRLLKISRKLYRKLDKSIYRALYVGDDLAVLLREYESGASSLKPLIDEVAGIVASEIGFAVSTLGSKLSPKERILVKALQESNAVIKEITKGS
ncbi:MAG: hypothetical protein NZ733_06450 [Aigarchaeota archaeon]|nr:hypothetical protein [Aigarchaeota archaeon]MCS7118373.1 hypothetical protein [Candidatus Calditenuaceae archaeon]MDW8042567.1 hypothetical protein [Nitrososphaerota archaeon]